MFRTAAFRHLFAAAARKGCVLPAIIAITMLTITSKQSAGDEPESCRPHSEVLSHLARSYGESPKSLGITDAGNLIEVLSATDGSTWSIVVTTPEGISCLVAAGEAWKELRGPVTDDGVLIQR